MIEIPFLLKLLLCLALLPLALKGLGFLVASSFAIMLFILSAAFIIVGSFMEVGVRFVSWLSQKLKFVLS